MNNLDIVRIASSKLAAPYWFGTFGQVASAALLEAKSKQYPQHYTADRMPVYKQQFGKQVFDCSGLLKYILMTEAETKPLKYIAALDYSADSFYQKAAVKGDISTLPEIPGIGLHSAGHVGLYIGNGKLIEARGFAYGTVQSNLQNRSFQHWFYLPNVDYPAPNKTNLKQIADQLKQIANQLDSMD